MKIPESNATNTSNAVNVSTLHNRGAEKAVKGSAGGSQGEGDQVQVSSLSSRLSMLTSQSESHASRLIELSDVVASGRYQVDAQMVSQRIIQEHMRLAA